MSDNQELHRQLDEIIDLLQQLVRIFMPPTITVGPPGIKVPGYDDLCICNQEHSTSAKVNCPVHGG